VEREEPQPSRLRHFSIVRREEEWGYLGSPVSVEQLRLRPTQTPMIFGIGDSVPDFLAF
jgi:hypothetical protein